MPSERLWERERQVAAGDDVVAAARHGRGGALLVLGDAGLGKTVLLEQMRRRVPDDVVVVRARCDPMETSLGFGVMSQVVHALGGGAAVWAQAAVEERSAAALFRTLRWLSGTGRGPVLVTIDDLQWADPDSLGFLGFLCRRLAGLPIAVVATMRNWPPAAADLARALFNGGDAVLEHLDPLSEQASARVLEQRWGGPVPAPVVARAWAVGRGNPLLLGLAAGPRADDAAGAGPHDGVDVTATERSLVLGRFSGLSVAGAAWARAAAVLGSRFRPELVSDLSGLGPAAGESAAEELWRSGLVRDGGEGTGEFVHPLFAQLLYDDLTPPARQGLHARAFTALLARRMDDAAAEHAVRADLIGDERAVAVVTEAARRALQAGATVTAANRLEAAVRLSGHGASASLRAELGEALLHAGRLDEAAAALTGVLDVDLPVAARVHALTMLSRVHFSRGEFHRADVALQRATGLAERECPQAVVLPLCHHATTVLMTAGPAAALPIAARALELARAGDAALHAHARATWGMVSLWCGDPAGLEAADAEGRHLLAGTPTETAHDLRSGPFGVLVPFATTAALAGRFDDAEAAYRVGIDEAERIGAVHAAAALRVAYGILLLRTRVGDSLAVADDLLAVADLVPVVEPFARTIRCCALLEMGEDLQSRAEGERARAAATPIGVWQSLHLLDHVQGRRLLREGRFRDASLVYAELEARERELGIREPCSVPYARHAVIAHVRAGRPADAERIIGRLDEHTSRFPCRWPVAAAAAGRAEIAVSRADVRDADRNYRLALEALEGALLPSEQGEVLIAHGTMLRHDGRYLEAREAFRRASHLADSAGAPWLRRRAEEELAAAGGRRVRRRSAQDLTPQEQRVSRLAATGASNKDIAMHLAVSVRTVRTHLEHVYDKLGIRSRRELMTLGISSRGPGGEEG